MVWVKKVEYIDFLRLGTYLIVVFNLWERGLKYNCFVTRKLVLMRSYFSFPVLYLLFSIRDSLLRRWAIAHPQLFLSRSVGWIRIGPEIEILEESELCQCRRHEKRESADARPNEIPWRKWIEALNHARSKHDRAPLSMGADEKLALFPHISVTYFSTQRTVLALSCSITNEITGRFASSHIFIGHSRSSGK